MLDHYLHTGYAAAGLLNRLRDMIGIGRPEPGTIVTELAGADAAAAWFAAEQPVLLAAVAGAAEAGFHNRAWRLAWTLPDFLLRTGAWHDWRTTQRIALAAARRSADRDGQARAHDSLANAYTWLGCPADARTHPGPAWRCRAGRRRPGRGPGRLAAGTGHPGGAGSPGGRPGPGQAG